MSDEMEPGLEEGNVSGPDGAGTLYVMRERDHRTGETFDYFKIGIVKGDRDVSRREKDHRTGNPRSIEAVFNKQSPAVQKLETLLHNHYAARRISSGEWFHFHPDELPRVLQGIQDAAIKVERFAAIDSLAGSDINLDSSLLVALPLHLRLAREYFVSESHRKQVEQAIKKISTILLSRKESDGDVSLMLKPRQTSSKTDFAVDELKKIDKALYEKFKTLAKTSYRFSILCEDEDALAAVEQLKAREEEKANQFDQWGSFDLHAEFLRLWALQSRLKFLAQLYELELKQATGISPGIESVTKWKEKVNISFDKEAFRAEHPDLYQQCIVSTDGATGFSVAEWASYVAPQESGHLVTEIFD